MVLTSMGLNTYRFMRVNRFGNEDTVYLLNWCSMGTCELCVLVVSFITEWPCCLKIRAY